MAHGVVLATLYDVCLYVQQMQWIHMPELTLSKHKSYISSS